MLFILLSLSVTILPISLQGAYSLNHKTSSYNILNVLEEVHVKLSSDKESPAWRAHASYLSYIILVHERRDMSMLIDADRIRTECRESGFADLALLADYAARLAHQAIKQQNSSAPQND